MFWGRPEIRLSHAAGRKRVRACAGAPSNPQNLEKPTTESVCVCPEARARFKAAVSACLHPDDQRTLSAAFHSVRIVTRENRDSGDASYDLDYRPRLVDVGERTRAWAWDFFPQMAGKAPHGGEPFLFLPSPAFSVSFFITIPLLILVFLYPSFLPFFSFSSFHPQILACYPRDSSIPQKTSARFFALPLGVQ